MVNRKELVSIKSQFETALFELDLTNKVGGNKEMVQKCIDKLADALDQLSKLVDPL